MYDDQLIVITGGAGFIGSNLIRYLNSKGTFNILVVDEFGMDEKWKNLVGKRFAEVIEKHQLFDWLKGRENSIRAFVHLGACSDTTELNASYLLENNYRFSVRLAEYALQNNHRFIYASSAATYGDGILGFSDDHAFLKELRPLNMYGYSKHLFDMWLQYQGLLNRVVGLKYFNVYGPNEGHKGRMASLLYHMYPKAAKEGVVRLFKSSDPAKFSDGGQMRDFIYVEDAVRMTAAFLENSATGIYNIGRGIPESWNHLAQALFNALDIPGHIEYFSMPHDLAGKYQNYTCAEVDKVKQVLGRTADCPPLIETVKHYVQNYLIPEKLW